MTEFLNQITTLNWWISVFLVGIVINLISNVIPKYWSYVIKQISSFRKSTREEYLEQQESRKQRIINLIKKDVDIISYYQLKLQLAYFSIILSSIAFFGSLTVLDNELISEEYLKVINGKIPQQATSNIVVDGYLFLVPLPLIVFIIYLNRSRRLRDIIYEIIKIKSPKLDILELEDLV